ncbi:hypothetical protein RAH32_09690 [Paracoccus sp. WLY502]|uniref:hypothetical protein n=1 Tax=Paracoccus yibinensis TaxID=3068891 RepID=UPI002796B6B6|nr:hypothetical protein [Paracoccus sp. WLY502]MDQ1900711.1 hypothetical protein [Paracoccus sp. WLY502]
MSQFHRTERKLAEKVQVSAREKSIKRLHDYSRMYLTSHACKYVAAAEAIKQNKRAGQRSVTELAERMNVFEACGEPVFLDLVARDESAYEYRYILSFGTENRARQILLRNLLKARWNVSRAQTMMNGGRNAAVQQVIRHYTEGYIHIAELDIKRCYKSFGMIGIQQMLHLPERVVRHVLSAASLNIDLSYTARRVIYHDHDIPLTPMELFRGLHGEDWDEAQQGLIEGSKVSPFVAELLLAPVCQAILASGAGVVINYADNFLLMAKTKCGLETMKTILREKLRTHPAGPLTVGEVYAKFALNSAFDFLGYKLVPGVSSLNPEISERNERKARKIRSQAYKAIRSNLSKEKLSEYIKHCVREHRSLLNAFPLWEGAEAYESRKLSALLRCVQSRITTASP